MKPKMRHPVTVRDDYTHETPGAVTGAVACGVAPVPLLAVYSVIFLIHGSFRPVHPPDVTDSTRGEFVAGWIALAVLVVLLAALLWFLNGRRRWPLALMQLGGLGAFVYVLVEPTLGGRPVAGLLALTSLASLVLMFAPSSWWWLERRAPGWVGAPGRLIRRPAEQKAGATV
jgi:hypothetical protein